MTGQPFHGGMTGQPFPGLHTPLGAALAAEARKAIAQHTDWDAPSEFVTLHWDGTRLRTGTLVAIMLDVHPNQYPAAMARAAAEQIRDHPDDPPVAYRIRCEAFGVMDVGPETPAAFRRQLDKDRRNRTYHQRPDAVEVCQVWVTDTAGDLWAATEQRGRPGDVTERFYAAGSEWMPGGQFINALLSLGEATAQVVAREEPR